MPPESFQYLNDILSQNNKKVEFVIFFLLLQTLNTITLLFSVLWREKRIILD